MDHQDMSADFGFSSSLWLTLERLGADYDIQGLRLILLDMDRCLASLRYVYHINFRYPINACVHDTFYLHALSRAYDVSGTA